MTTYSSDVAFTPTVKALQELRGSRDAYRRMEEKGSWRTRIDADLADFITAQTSMFLASSNEVGQPYIQHRGGPAGFLRVLDEATIGFADFTGNKQYITLGNLSRNPKVQLLLIDYTARRRIKIWGEARVILDDSDLVQRLKPADYKAKVEQAILVTVKAWDSNCSQHIPQRFEASDVAVALFERDQRILQLEAELSHLRGNG